MAERNELISTGSRAGPVTLRASPAEAARLVTERRGRDSVRSMLDVRQRGLGITGDELLSFIWSTGGGSHLDPTPILVGVVSR